MDTLSIIKEILDRELELPQGRCFAYNGAEDLPKDSDLFIVLYFGARTPFANNIRYEGEINDLKAVQSYNVVEDIQIAVMSRNTTARNRVHEVLMALASVTAQEIQEKYRFHLSTIGDVVDNSFLEATARLNRFDVSCRVIRAYEKQKSIDYYDKFPLTSKLDANYLID